MACPRCARRFTGAWEWVDREQIEEGTPISTDARRRFVDADEVEQMCADLEMEENPF